jgi:glycosyltransferase involved in cell wall biosynthesis
LDVHAVSIQFIHHQWTKKGLEMENAYPLRKIYKRILFSYFQICENYLFSKKNLKFFSPAIFLTDFLKEKYPGINAQTIYSGVNLNRFELNFSNKSEIKSELLEKYPILKDLDVSRPIYLFVGAFERKGLDKAIDLLKEKKGAQFIVIGSPSMGKTMHWPRDLIIFPVKFTREIAKFYALADMFLFPTAYEPFGLVLFEAMAMGLGIVTCKFEVGASELLKGLPEIYFADEDQFEFPVVLVKNHADKNLTREERIKKLGDVSWEKAGEELARFLFIE